MTFIYIIPILLATFLSWGEVAFEKAANAGGRFTNEEENGENCRNA